MTLMQIVSLITILNILITIISCDYLNLSLVDEHVGDVTIPTQVIEYNQNVLQTDFNNENYSYSKMSLRRHLATNLALLF
jgi:hypothetical protein